MGTIAWDWCVEAGKTSGDLVRRIGMTGVGNGYCDVGMYVCEYDIVWCGVSHVYECGGHGTVIVESERTECVE